MLTDVKLKKIYILKKEIERLFRENIIDKPTRNVLMEQASNYMENEIYLDTFEYLRKIDKELEQKGAYDNI